MWPCLYLSAELWIAEPRHPFVEPRSAGGSARSAAAAGLPEIAKLCRHVAKQNVETVVKMLAFEGARKITSEEYQAGDRFAVQRHEDSLRLGTEVRKDLPKTFFSIL